MSLLENVRKIVFGKVNEVKHTHIVHLVKNQHGSWGSTEIGSKTVKIHVPGDDKLGVEYHASQAASKAGYKRLRNGDSVSHSVSKIEKIGESVNESSEIVFEGHKAAPSLSHVLKSHGWKKHRETPVYDYYSHKDHPGREIGTPVRGRGSKGMWYHHAPEHKEPESAWTGRANAAFGRGTAQLKDHLDEFHKTKNESVGNIYKSSQEQEWLSGAKQRGLHVIKHLTDYDGNGEMMHVAKDKSGNRKGIFHLKNGGHLSESVQIDELSKKTLGAYIRKAHSDSVTRSNHRAQDVADRREHGYKSGNTSRYDKRIATADRKLDNREVGTRRAVNRLTKEDNVIDRYLAKLQEGRGRPRKDGSSASEEDSADGHIMMQLRKVVSLRGQKPVKFGNGETYGIHPSHAYKALDKYTKLKKADDKESFVKKLGHSRGSFFQAMQEEYEMIESYYAEGLIEMMNEDSVNEASNHSTGAFTRARSPMHSPEADARHKGYTDVINGQGFHKEYDSWEPHIQRNYERGRQHAALIKHYNSGNVPHWDRRENWNSHRDKKLSPEVKHHTIEVSKIFQRV